MPSHSPDSSFKKNTQSILEARETERKLKSELEQLDQELYQMTDITDVSLLQNLKSDFSSEINKSQSLDTQLKSELSQEQYVDIVEMLREKLETTLNELQKERQKVRELQDNGMKSYQESSPKLGSLAKKETRSPSTDHLGDNITRSSRNGSRSTRASAPNSARNNAPRNRNEKKNSILQEANKNNNGSIGARNSRTVENSTGNDGSKSARNRNRNTFGIVDSSGFDNTFSMMKNDRYSEESKSRKSSTSLGIGSRNKIEKSTYKVNIVDIANMNDEIPVQRQSSPNLNNTQSESRKLNNVNIRTVPRMVYDEISDQSEELEELRAENELLKVNLQLLQNHNEMIKQQYLNEKRNRKLVSQHCKSLEALLAQQKEEVNKFILQHRTTSEVRAKK